MTEPVPREDNLSALIPKLNWGDPVDRDGEFILPVGTVTMLLADVEGSTRRWVDNEAEMGRAMAALLDLVDEVIGRHNGVRPLDQGEGDSFVAAFARPSEAVACALEIEGSATLPLRIGIHVGEAQRTDEGNYVGPELNRAARVRDSAHGGQVVLSQAAAELVVDRLPKEASLRDLGTHRLRDLSRPERIFQLVHPDLRADFLPLRSLDAYRHNLPTLPTSFIGRQTEMAAVESLMSESNLLTLTGAGGCGKTRLVLQVAAGQVDDFQNGVFFCDLSRVTEPTDVPRAAASAIGLAEEAVGNIVPFLKDKRLLLVLDNCEHVIEACAGLCQAILAGAPSVHIVATSREPLRVDGETTYVVPSLPVPPVGEIGGIEGLAPYAAGELFLDRARKARTDLVLSNDEASVVGDICRRLDGIPLAIELAAARVRVMSPQQIADSLNERFRILTGGARTAMPRHQTLAASVDWSYELLTEPERVVLRRLSVLVGGFGLEAASDVCSGPGIDQHHVLDLLSLLVEKSLVNVDTTGGQTRYQLLETIRQYTAARLNDSNEEEQTRRSHRDHFLALAERCGESVWGPDGVSVYDAFLRDRENLEAAFRWSLAWEDFEQAARFATVLSYLLELIWAGEAMAWIAPVIAAIERVPEPVRTDALYARAALHGHPPAPELDPILQESIALHRESGDSRRFGRALLAWAVLSPGEESLTALEEAVQLARESDSPHSSAVALSATASALGFGPETVERADRYVDELMEILQQSDAPMLLQYVGWKVVSAMNWRDPRRALAAGESLLTAGFERVPDLYRHSRTLRPISLIVAGLLDEGRALAEHLIPLHEAVGDMSCLSLQHWAMAIAAEGSDSDLAISHLERSIAARAQTPFLTTWTGGATLAFFRLGRGEIDQAERILQKISDAPEDPISATYLKLLSAGINHERGDIERCEEEAHQAMTGAGAFWMVLVPSLELVASVAAEESSYLEASRLMSGVAAYRERIGLRWGFRFFTQLSSRTLASIKEGMSEEDFERSWDEGAAMSIDEIVSYARRGRGERKRPATGWRSLTPTEQQVVDLLVEGLSNKEIAARMFVSVRTITTHLTHVFAKLGISSRTELVSGAMTRSSKKH